MEQVEVFEKAVEKIRGIEQIADDDARVKAGDEFYDSLGENRGLFVKYDDAIRRGNDYIDFDDCPSNDETPAFVARLRNCGAQHITVSSGWSSLVENMWALCENGCKIEGMVEINGRSKDWETGEYDKIPAFLIKVGLVDENEAEASKKPESLENNLSKNN